MTTKKAKVVESIYEIQINNYIINATLTICQNVCGYIGTSLIGSHIPPIIFFNSDTTGPSKAILNLQTKQLKFFDSSGSVLADEILYLSITYSKNGNCIYAWVRNDITQALSFTEGADPETDPPS